jgi:hypothetical protein
MLLHGGGGTAVPHHHTIVVLVSGVPQCAFDNPGSCRANVLVMNWVFSQSI